MLDTSYTFQLDLGFKLMNLLSGIDRFEGSWAAIERREGIQTLKQLKSIATVHSVGASTRIEGSKMTNNEVRALIFDNIKVERLEERDQQEVIGYFNTLDIISESYQDIAITEGHLKNLHNILMKFSDKDQWHKGNYKQHPNSVEATNPDGTKNVIFETTPPGFETEDAMRSLVEWYNSDHVTPPIIKSALFVYDFLSIHPFQDGNGRLSRLLGTLLLLKHGYPWIQYVSFEHEIESRKLEYYSVLMECQHQRPGENVTSWVLFFLDCLGRIQNKLMQKLDAQKSESQMSPREKMIYGFIENHPGSKSGEIAEKLNIPLPTVKRILSEMAQGKFIMKHGSGAGTNYTTENLTMIRKHVTMSFSDTERNKQLTLKNKHTFIEITKVILTPRFNWNKPDDWGKVLINQGLMLEISCSTNLAAKKGQAYSISGFTNPYYYEPVFTLKQPIHIPGNLWEGIPNDNEYPINAVIALTSRAQDWQFDVMVVYDAALE